MSKESDITKQWMNDLPAGTEKPGFKPEEMIVCEKCSRKNPPTRSNCFYCAAELTGDEIQAAVRDEKLRQMEYWEKGYNIILLNSSSAADNDENIRTAAVLLGWEIEEVKSILFGRQRLPIAKVLSLQAAETVKWRLKGAGFDSFIWPDDEIQLASPTRRLRGLTFSDEGLTLHLFNTGEEEKIAWNEIALIVKGSLFEKRIASTEKRKKNEEKQVTDSSETIHDEPVIDIYSRDDDRGWRILTKGFDFSCLGAEKSMLAVENIKRLVDLISARAVNARVDDDYSGCRAFLGRNWPNEEKLASHNWQRESMGRFHFDNVTAINNNAQFTKYSRLQWRLLKETNS